MGSKFIFPSLNAVCGWPRTIGPSLMCRSGARLPSFLITPAGSTPATPAPANPAAPQANGAVAIARLERLYKVEQGVLERQATVLSNAERLISRAENIVQRLKARGLDTSKLEAALKDLKADLAQAQTDHDQAAGILATHAGFDAQGKVTDRQLARQTVVDAGKAIALALGIGLGALGAGVGIGNIFGSMIQAVARQPELRGELTGIQWLGFALTEAVVFYGLLGSILAYVLV